MKTIRNLVQIFSFFFLLSLILPAFATSGNTDYGYGIISKSMGGTGVALPESPLIAALNPAGLACLPHEVEVGTTIFSPRRGYTANNVAPEFFGVAPGTHWSDRLYFLIPNFGYARPFANGQAVWGIAMYANGGINTTYRNNFSGSTIGMSSGVYGGNDTGVDLKQLFVNFSIALKVRPNLLIGGSLIPAYQSFKIRGVSPFAPASVNPDHVSDLREQNRYGLGTRLGVIYTPIPCISLGASYQPRIHLPKTDRFGGLLVNNGALNIPPNGTIGMTYTPQPCLSINTDIQRIWYRNVPAYGNINAGSFDRQFLGIRDGAAFGWRQTTLYKVGLRWVANDCWIWRAGYAFSTQNVMTSETVANIVAPGVTQSHFAMGFTRLLNPCLKLNGSLMYAPKVTVRGPNFFNKNQEIAVFMRQYEIGASLIWKLGDYF